MKVSEQLFFSDNIKFFTHCMTPVFLLYRTSQFSTINEGNEGCFWFLLAAPSVFLGYLVGGFGAVLGLVAFGLAIRARSLPLILLSLMAIAAGVGVVALGVFGEHLLFE